jgi:hypothetical protein
LNKLGKLNLSDRDIVGNNATMLGRCNMQVLTVLLAREGDTGAIVSKLLSQNKASFSVAVRALGSRMQCAGTSVSSSMHGQK